MVNGGGFDIVDLILPTCELDWQRVDAISIGEILTQLIYWKKKVLNS